MTMATKTEVFRKYLSAYLKADKAGKGKILDTVCEVTDMHRKAAVRKFRKLQMQDGSVPERRGRPCTYTPDVIAALKDVWETGSEVCGELLHPLVNEYVSVLKRDRLWTHGKEATEKLLRMSEGTMKAKVGAFFKLRKPLHGKSATTPSHLKEIIPIFTGPWEGKPPGFGQIDTVVHCGSSLVGDLVYTLNYTDVATFWIVPVAQWNKGQRTTQESLTIVQKKLPVPVLGMHPDTGSEFINWFVRDWCVKEGIELTRSRPNHKNDNAYVEQKNGHVVRRFLGYTRFDVREIVSVMNDYYEVLGLYVNHFVASRKCLEKVRIGSKYRKKYDRGQTPYQRMLAHPAVSKETKEKLRREHEMLNPLLLKRKLDTLKTKLITIQRATVPQGVSGVR
jgi:hypothetical protein